MATKPCSANIKPMPGRKRIPAFDRTLYRKRNVVERFFNKLKHFRSVATRYDKISPADAPDGQGARVRDKRGDGVHSGLEVSDLHAHPAVRRNCRCGRRGGDEVRDDVRVATRNSMPGTPRTRLGIRTVAKTMPAKA